MSEDAIFAALMRYGCTAEATLFREWTLERLSAQCTAEIHLRTEQEMHQAWRKRAEEAEIALEAQREMLKKLAGEHTAGCAKPPVHGNDFEERECDCPCGEIRKLLGGE